MSARENGLIDRMILRQSLRRWRSLAQQVPVLDPEALQAEAERAAALRAQLDIVTRAAEAERAAAAIGAQDLPRTFDADWVWRPDLWFGPADQPGAAEIVSGHRLSDEVAIFHDCPAREISLRQLRNSDPGHRAGFGLRMDVFAFEGSYLSLTVDLPEAAVEGLKRSHLVRVDPIVWRETPIKIFARLNIKHGPNTEQVVRELPLHQDDGMVEFDLAYTKMNEKRIERLWLDLIFGQPQMNQIVLRDLTVSRRPRAEL